MLCYRVILDQTDRTAQTAMTVKWWEHLQWRACCQMLDWQLDLDNLETDHLKTTSYELAQECLCQNLYVCGTVYNRRCYVLSLVVISRALPDLLVSLEQREPAANGYVADRPCQLERTCRGFKKPWIMRKPLFRCLAILDGIDLKLRCLWKGVELQKLLKTLKLPHCFFWSFCALRRAQEDVLEPRVPVDIKEQR